jgi:hypothetical protein
VPHHPPFVLSLMVQLILLGSVLRPHCQRHTRPWQQSAQSHQSAPQHHFGGRRLRETGI